MEAPYHSIESLFDQLGLGSSEEEIEGFINKNNSLPGHLELYKANFWTNSQADFLKQMKDDDSDWSTVVDLLDTMLR